MQQQPDDQPAPPSTPGTPGPADGSAADPDRDRLGTELKRAFDALRDRDLPAEARPALHQRLIAITNSAKHDLATAERRMAGFWEALDEAHRRGGTPGARG